jgi:hypothetical protein
MSDWDILAGLVEEEVARGTNSSVIENCPCGK